MAIVPVGILVDVGLKVPNRMMRYPKPSFEHHYHPMHLLEVLPFLS